MMTSVVCHCVMVLSVLQLSSTGTATGNTHVFELCSNVTVVRTILENQCVFADIGILTDPLDGCRFEIISVGCVLGDLKSSYGISCSPSDILQTLRRDEVRQGLLDSVAIDYCDANLQDSQCELDFFIKLFQRLDCFESLSLLYIRGPLYNSDTILSADGQGKLKCRIFVESLRCAISVQDVNETCSAADFAPALRKVMKIYAELYRSSIGNFTQVGVSQADFTQVDLLECDADIPDEFPPRTCPPTSLAADIIVAQCAGQIHLAARYEICMVFGSLDYCVKGTRKLFPDGCPSNYLQLSIEEHAMYLGTVMDVFDLPTQCKIYSHFNCTNEDDCWHPEMGCRNNVCACASPGYYYDHSAYQCFYFGDMKILCEKVSLLAVNGFPARSRYSPSPLSASPILVKSAGECYKLEQKSRWRIRKDCHTLASEYLTLRDQMIYDDERCVIAISYHVSVEACFKGCTAEPACRAARYDHYFSRCFFLSCYDLSASFYYPGVDSFVVGCQDDVVDNVTGVIVVGSVVECYPNGTMKFSNPLPAIYIDAMAVQNEGSQQAVRCSTILLGSDVFITGCDMNAEVTVFLSPRADSQDGIFGGRTSHAFTVRCNTLAESGVTRTVEDLLVPQLPFTTEAGITPSFVVTSALRSQSVTGKIMSSAVVGQTLFWTIDVPLEYKGRPTCFAYSGTSTGGTPSLQLVADGCSIDRHIIAGHFNAYMSPVEQSTRMWTLLYVFKFYNSDDIFFRCTVKVCPHLSSSCNFDCGNDKRRAIYEDPDEKGEYFTVTQHLQILSSSSNSVAFAYGVWFAVVCFTFFSL